MIAKPSSDLRRIRFVRRVRPLAVPDTFPSAAAIARSTSAANVFKWAAKHCSLLREGCQSADERRLRRPLALGFQMFPVILHHCVPLDSFEPPACKMNSCNRDAASSILWQQQLSKEVFVLWSNSSNQSSGTSSRPTCGVRIMRISQLPAEASEIDADSSGMDESRT
jgi:hypothetical protein